MQPENHLSHLSFAFSLCGKCSETCPVKINLHHLLLHNRKDKTEQEKNPFIERILVYVFKTAALNRDIFNFGSHRIRNFMLNIFFRKARGNNRELPVFEKSFNKQWEIKSL